MIDKIETEALIEAALLTSSEPLSKTALQRLCKGVSEEVLYNCLKSLKKRWQNRALQLVSTQDGWRFQVLSQAFEQLSCINEQRTPRYSRAVMETLAVIAYRQPVTRSEIEAIRGVSVSQNVLQILLSRRWIEVVGHRDSIGKPALWATTEVFLADFQLADLNQLPPLAELGELLVPEMLLSN